MVILTLFILYAAAFTMALARAGLWSPAPTSLRAPGKPVNKVLIVGATGGTGRQLIVQALELGFRVTAFVRDPSRLTIEHPNLRVVRGDVMDTATVEEAAEGQDAVLCALGHKQYWGRTRVLSEGTQNIIRAMKAHGVTRLVCETSLGIGSSAGRMGLYYTFFVLPVILPLYFWDKTHQERMIAESSLEWVIVRPGALTNAAGRGVYRHGTDVGNLLSTVRIARADVAHFMLEQAINPSYLHTAVSVSW